MSKWKKYRLKDLCSRLSSGKNIQATNVSDEGLYPVYGGNGLRGYANISNFEGDCALIGRQGAYCGNVRYFSGRGYITEHAVVACGNDFVCTRFLAYLLSIQDLGRLSAQSAQPGLSVKQLGEEVFSLPPLPTQRKIAAVLGALDDKIENNRKICANLEAQAQAIFKSWFVDFKPFGGKMPQGWKMGMLGDVAECNQDSYSAKDGWTFVNYLDTGSITRNQIQDIQEIPMSEAPSRARRKVRKLSIVYSTVRPNQCHYGIIHDVKEHMLVSTGFAVIDAKESISPYRIFLELTQDCVTRQLQVLAEQSVCTYPALNPSDILAREMVIPELSVEQRFDSAIRPMFEQMELANQESRSLAALRDALLPKLMSGEIDVEKVKF